MEDEHPTRPEEIRELKEVLPDTGVAVISVDEEEIDPGGHGASYREFAYLGV